MGCDAVQKPLLPVSKKTVPVIILTGTVGAKRFCFVEGAG